MSRELLQRAKEAGYSAIVFTIDAFAPGASDEALRLGFSFPPSLPLVNSGTPFFKRSLSWADVDFIKETTDLPLVIKGVVSPQLAKQAIDRGAAALQVSNHGGRGLDGVPASIDLLPSVVEAADGRVPIILIVASDAARTSSRRLQRARTPWRWGVRSCMGSRWAAPWV